MHKVFKSYHHANDQWYKDELERQNKLYEIFIDKSVDTGDIDDSLPDETIRTIIRDDYLRDSTVTILLLGTETQNRKHIDWELYSSMFNGTKNKKSGLLIVNLPSISSTSSIRANSEEEKKKIHPHIQGWCSVTSREEYRRRHPHIPERIIDNFLKGVKISIVNWDDINHKPDNLRLAIDEAHKFKETNEYCLKRAMKRKNS